MSFSSIFSEATIPAAAAAATAAAAAAASAASMTRATATMEGGTTTGKTRRGKICQIGKSCDVRYYFFCGKAKTNRKLLRFERILIK